MAKKISGDGVVDLSVVGDETSGETYEEIRQRVKELKEKVDQDGWELSEAIYEVHTGALYQAWGFSSWKDYVDRELEFKARKASYLISTQAWVRGFKPDFVEWVKRLGLSKARLMSAHNIKPEEADIWRAKLDGKSYREIEEILSGKDPNDGYDGPEDGDEGESGEGSSSSTETAEVWKTALYPEQRRNVDLAIERAKVIGETDVTGNALDLICTDFLSGNGHIKDTGEYLSLIEKNLGITIIAFKSIGDGKEKVVYGSEFLDKLTEEVEE